MKNKFLITLLILFCSTFLEAAPLQLQRVQITSVNNTTEFQFDFSALPHQNLMVLKDPDRIVLDFEKTILKTNLPILSSSILYLKRISMPQMKTQKVRVMLELSAEVQYKTSLKKIGKQAYRYSLILRPATEVLSSLKAPVAGTDTESESNKPLEAKSVKAVLESVPPQPTLSPKVAVLTNQQNEKREDLIVVLDPGHGGKDSGAQGKQGTEEKTVVLAIALSLQKELQAVPGIKVYMTRSTDIFIPLRDRLSIARKRKADLFIALHADAFKNASARGASIFALSQRGATSEGAHWLAEKENESEMLGGADLSDKDHLLKSVLIDMSQTVTINSSILLGQQILDRFHAFTLLHSHKVEQAAFVVLKSPDIPSILIENGFISNPQEERNLSSSDYQEKLAKEIKRGVVNYFIENASMSSVFYQAYQKQKKM
jgi:N-acetylmuramoyl-L-alanine amidase